MRDYYGPSAAQEARREFENIFKEKNIPKNIPLKKISVKSDTLPLLNLLDFDVNLLYTNSTKNELRRLIQQGAVKVNGRKVESINFELSIGQEYMIQVAKRSFVRVLLVKQP